MQISFLLGPAGTGKTFRCLEEIRNALLSAPEGPALLFIAPKQSTYQLERQLLEGAEISGFTRLHILSFERLAEFTFAQYGRALPRIISEQGRTMVLRALLARFQADLNVFRGAARRPGFAEELGQQLREFRNHGLNPQALRKMAFEIDHQSQVRAKLEDLALLFEQYNLWLAERNLEDGDALLGHAADLLEQAPAEALRFGGIWCDGFAQLTPQELRLLVALPRFASRTTLAFCVEQDLRAEPAASPISPWHLVYQTVERCRSALGIRYERETLRTEWLARLEQKSRFSSHPALRHLERTWTTPAPFLSEAGGEAFPIQIIPASDPENEAIFAAREILKFVRNGGRFREAALLLRDLQNDYPHILRRVFRRYEIPHFLDHRESISHHPLAELTRGAIRTVAFNWKHSDWFAVLKCGLVHVQDLDELENEALARGWEGGAWKNAFRIPKDLPREERLNRLRARILEPFSNLAATLGIRPSSEQLVSGLRTLWNNLSVEKQLDAWTQERSGATVHSTVWEQLNSWLDDLALAFPGQQLSLGEWLPILEAGLMSLTVGVIPPVLDQVLIGTVDRSRNPDLKLLFVLGLNERIFPAAQGRDTLLSPDDRSALATTGCTLGDLPAQRLAGEQFYGYIAMTRARERLCLSFARAGSDGALLHPSRFVTQLGRIFPGLKPAPFAPPATLSDCVHGCELEALGIPRLESDGSPALCTANQEEKLDPALALRLYGEELNLSVSALERFAACPFQFFVQHGLHVREREEFALDVREQGSFQHEVLAAFHEELIAARLKWRDLTPAQARTRVGIIAENITRNYRDGLLIANEQNRYTAENYKIALQDFIAVIIQWFNTNSFDPERVEFGFGRETTLPGWRLPLRNGHTLVLHGRVDRIDLYRKSETEACCIIIDYKSGMQKPDRTLLHHGVQQQLPGYMLALTRHPEIAAHFHVDRLTAAGCFILPLTARYESTKTRRDALADPDAAQRAAYLHEGIFDVDQLALLDSRAPEESSGQFKYRLTSSGEPHAGTFRALTSNAFADVLTRSEQLMRSFGERIYTGDIAIHPYKKGAAHACERCRMQPVCRFDSWTQPHNILRAPEKIEIKAAGKKK